MAGRLGCGSARRWALVGLLCALGAGCRREQAPRVTLPAADPAQFAAPLSLALWQEPGSWPQFAHDPLHTGRGDADFTAAELKQVWQFRPTDHIYEYQPGMSVWSSPIAGTVNDRPLVIAGYYDRNVYAADGETGKKVWEFRPGATVFATPALGVVNGRAMVFVAATNRCIYGLDAATGEQRWVFETTEWTFTGTPSQMSSPTLVDDGGRPVLLVGVWNGDRSAAHNRQAGELVALNAADGSLKWRRGLATTPVASPAVARMGPELAAFVSTHHGVVCALSMSDGRVLYESTLNEVSRSSPSLAWVGGAARLFVGTRQHSIFAFDLETGGRDWRTSASYWIDSTPAWFEQDGRVIVAAGSYDRGVYGWNAADGQQAWKLTTGNYAYASPAVATLQGRPIVLFMSYDQALYMIDGLDGRELWKVKGGPLIWSHSFQGDSLWASPAVARIRGKPTVLFASFDGTLYAYQ